MAPPLGGVRDEESIRSPARSPGKAADPLQALATAPTAQQKAGKEYDPDLLWCVFGLYGGGLLWLACSRVWGVGVGGQALGSLPGWYVRASARL